GRRARDLQGSPPDGRRSSPGAGRRPARRLRRGGLARHPVRPRRGASVREPARGRGRAGPAGGRVASFRGGKPALAKPIGARPPQPLTRPPFPVESGLYGKPTVINNVETLSAVPAIVRGGPAWFAGLGATKGPGAQIFGLSGPIRRPGVVEVRNGLTLRDLLERIGGGLVEQKA